MMGHKERLKSGTEWDVVGARHFYCYIANTDVAHKIKKQLSRRNRREAKQALRKFLDAA